MRLFYDTFLLHHLSLLDLFLQDLAHMSDLAKHDRMAGRTWQTWSQYMPQIPGTAVKPAGCQGTAVFQTLKPPSILFSQCFMCFKLYSVTLKTHEHCFPLYLLLLS